MKLADTPDLGSGAPRRGGSSPLIRTIQNSIKYYISRFKVLKGSPSFLFFNLFNILEHSMLVCFIIGYFALTGYT